MNQPAIVVVAMVSLLGSAGLYGVSSSPPKIAPQMTKPLAYLGLDFRWQHDAARTKFLHVARVTAGAPADKAGIRPGDIITHIAGVPVGFGDELDFLIFMRDRAPGERLILEVVRSGTRLKIVATLGALPEAARSAWERGFRIAREKRATARAQRR